MSRLLGVLLTVLFAIATAILAWPQFFRLESEFPVAQLVAVRGVLLVAYLAIAALAVLFSLSKRMRGFAASILIVALLGALAQGGVLLTRGLGPGELPDKGAQSLRVMTWNTAGEAVSAEEIARAVVEYEVDIVALPETASTVGEAIALQLRGSGHPMWVHHVDFRPDVPNGPQAWQTTILLSPELGEYSVIESSRDGSSNTGQVPSAVVMPVSGRGPIIVAVHAVAPRLGSMEQWAADLQWVADQCPSGDVIMAGDFNSTVDHFSAFATTGDFGACVDAAAQVGAGAAATWPASAPALLGAPIDHVMATTNWVAEGAIVPEDAGGSDHRALIVQLAPAAP